LKRKIAQERRRETKRRRREEGRIKRREAVKFIRYIFLV
jgi:hypothetical protein